MKKILVIILFFAVLIFGCSMSWKNTKASLPDLDGKPDGIYRGEYHVSGTPVKAVMDVSLENGQLTLLKIVNHTSSPVGKKAETIVNDIIEKQSLGIDAVSGATASSIAILKAVENALR